MAQLRHTGIFAVAVGPHGECGLGEIYTGRGLPAGCGLAEADRSFRRREACHRPLWRYSFGVWCGTLLLSPFEDRR